ncbi:MAG: chemotaxis response regulator protein-glutamate methylesterase [Pirellulales bacterium]|nr:chemotaxis response regulator protein-glutamate methylesterase [Pirellulales bacterium]
MSNRPIRLLVVDDSKLIRMLICEAVNTTDDILVVAEGKNGKEAIELARKHKPDVITLDVQMPVMTGLEAIEKILEVHPVPIIMVSALTRRSADQTLTALDLGALDYIAKPEGNVTEIKKVFHSELLRKVRASTGVDIRRVIRIRKERQQRRQKTPPALSAKRRQDVEFAQSLADKCIAIGTSTGGPPALTSLFSELKPPLPPIVVVQHMPEKFTSQFAWRLNSVSELEIKEAKTGDVLKPNDVLIAPGGAHLELHKFGSVVKARIHDGDVVSGHKPSVDVMMSNAAKIYGERCLGVIMTGMGYDGSNGCGEIKAAGGYVIGQDQATSDVSGMNKVAFVNGNLHDQFPLDEAPARLHSWAEKQLALAPA